MAFVSTRGVYALAVMHVLANATNARLMQIKEIAAMTQLPHNYLEQILSKLKKEGLVVSQRGSSGGYKLAKSASQITVLEILTPLEGPLGLVGSKRGSSVVLDAFWDDIEQKVQKLFTLKLSELDRAYQPYFYDI